LTVGVSGILGAVVGASIGQDISPSILKPTAGLALWILAALVWLRTRMRDRIAVMRDPSERHDPNRQMATAVGLGVSGGAAAAFFGVGMAPYLQLGFLTALKLPLRQTVGTTMLTLVFISGTGATMLARTGDVSAPHLIGTVVGLATGSFIGARYTGRAPRSVLRFSVVAVPIVAGAMLLFI
jgi:uncharacterized membrane protein YfcA